VIRGGGKGHQQKLSGSGKNEKILKGRFELIQKARMKMYSSNEKTSSKLGTSKGQGGEER